MAKQLNASRPIVMDNGTMEPPFRDYMRDVSDNLPLLGDGSPEGNVNAPQFSLYIDRLGGTGTTEYRKMQSEIGGDTKKGWILM